MAANPFNLNNPFERDPKSTPLIKFSLHSDSLCSEIFTEGSSANRLVKCAGLKETYFLPLPTSNVELTKLFIQNGLMTTEYCSDKSGTYLNYSNGGISDAGQMLPAHRWDPLAPNSSVTITDSIASHSCDYLVAGETDPAVILRNVKSKIISAKSALSLLRILLVSNDKFYINPKYTCNEGFYYLFRFKSLFPEFQKAWTVAVYAQGKSMPVKVFNHLDSLSRRLELICRAYDKTAFYSLKSANNDTQDNQLYHLAYFVMLLTGSFDDLAHILKEIYQLPANTEFDITIRTHLGKTPKKFLQVIENKNKSLYQFIINQEIQESINALYPIRDSLQHRELLRGIHCGSDSGMDKNLFQISPETVESIGKIPCVKSFMTTGLPFSMLDPLPFIEWAQELSIMVTNGILRLIDWESMKLALSQDIQAKINDSNERFNIGAGHALGFQAEPLYF